MGILKNGTTGNDTLTSTAVGDTLAGGSGNDTYVVGHASVVIQEDYYGGADTVRTSYLDEAGVYSLRNMAYVENLVYTGTLGAGLQGNSLNNSITGAGGNDTIAGGAGSDSLYGGAGDDLISGGTGDDLLDGGSGADTLIGGAGNDTYLVSSSLDQVLEGVNQGFDTIKSAGTVKSLNVSKFVNFEGLTYTGTTAATLTGNKADNAITSTDSAADTLYGLDGNDTLDGGAGNDSMTGGVGDDTYLVNAGDLVFENVGEGIDTLKGTIVSINTTTAGANFATRVENLTYTGTTGATLTGNAMNNIIIGGTGSDSILGGTGIDLLDGGEGGTDTLVGGAGDDRYLISDQLDRISEGADSIGGGNDWIFSSIDIKIGDVTKYGNVNHLALIENAWYGAGNATNNVIVGNSSSNYLAGLAGNDILIGTATAQPENLDGFAVTADPYNYYTEDSDVLDGGDGNDILIGNLYSYGYSYSGDALLGGLGNDTYVIGNASDTVSDSGGTDTVYSLLASLSIEDYEGVEKATLADATMLSGLGAQLVAAGVSSNLVSSAANGSLTGNDLANTLTGNSGANVLAGGIGNDTLLGGDGNDTLIGGAGNDSLVGGNGNDVYDIDSGDTIVEAASGGIDAIRSATITSLSGYTNVEGLLYTGTGNVSLTGTAGADWLGGGSGNDTLTGLAGVDTLSGGAGADSIDGGADGDSLAGDAGNDTLLGGLGNDSIYGGLGTDSLRGGDGNDQLFADSSSYDYDNNEDAVTNASGTVTRYGNKLYGEAGADTLYGGSGADTLDGGADNDQLYGMSGNDSLLGGDGNDQLYGESSYSSETGNDTLNGGAGNDSLYGGNGNDVLYASGTLLATDSYNESGDRLEGGTGNDTFRFSEAYGTTTNYFATGHMIADFVSGSDKLSIAKELVGNGDTTLTSATATAGTAYTPPATTFSNTAELVVFSGNTGLSFAYSNYYGINATLASSVATAIGSASASFAVGDERLFVVNDGTSSGIFQFQSAGADALVSASELKLIGVVYGDAALSATDFSLF